MCSFVCFCVWLLVVLICLCLFAVAAVLFVAEFGLVVYCLFLIVY